ncbi:hypothetical protein AQ709_05350 [Burkholderia pseudomallei]|nr:hypothetical protein AQ709_05350 [Burkholderia pseudomallei]OMQ74417.1 hypothetical protein AQ711_23105 [Burkholderia pseudomallei]OMQ77305.1 hypothetical protein AQ712_02610 [Burkholderia pseudomallei]
MQAEGYSRAMADALMQGPAALRGEVDRQQKLNQLSQDETDRLRALDNRWKDFKEGLQTTGARIVIALEPAFNTVAKLLNGLSNWFVAHADQIGAQAGKIADHFVEWFNGIDWAQVAKNIEKVANQFVAWLDGIDWVQVSSYMKSLFGEIGHGITMIGRLGDAFSELGEIINALTQRRWSDVISHGKKFWNDINHLDDGDSNGLHARVSDGSVSIIPGSGPTDSASVGERGRYILQQARQRGYSDTAAAGIVGSLLQENSTLDPKVTNSIGATGIAQWLDPSRKAAFERTYGHSLKDSTFSEQVDFMFRELETTEKRAGDKLRAAQTAAQAAEIHGRDYERPGKEEANIPRRQRNAQVILAGMNRANAAQIAQQTTAATSSVSNSTTTSNTTTSEAHIGNVNVYTQAADAPGIARDFARHTKAQFMLPQANTGLS